MPNSNKKQSGETNRDLSPASNEGDGNLNKLGEINRRSMLRSLGIASGVSLTGFSTNALAQSESPAEEQPVQNLAIDALPDPKSDQVFFTTTLLGDGYQMYVGKGTSSVEEAPDTIEQVTNANVGVHGLSWEKGHRIKYSQDGRTYIRSVSKKGDVSSPQLVSNEPLPFSQGEVTIMANWVYCELGWCIRLANDDYGSLDCGNTTVPPMTHGHFAIYRQGANWRNTGFNIWIGKDGNCIWAGEEHRTKWCTKVCGPDGGLPGIGALQDAFEDAINNAADAAGIAIPAAVVVAIAYYLAVTTLLPPVGVPGI